MRNTGVSALLQSSLPSRELTALQIIKGDSLLKVYKLVTYVTCAPVEKDTFLFRIECVKGESFLFRGREVSVDGPFHTPIALLDILTVERSPGLELTTFISI